MSRFAQTMFSSVSRARSIAGALTPHIALVNAVSFALVILLAVVYIIQINSTVTQGYQIRELETHIHELSMENQRMEVATRQVQSLEHVTSSMKMLGMVPAGTPQYVAGGAPSYALAK